MKHMRTFTTHLLYVILFMALCTGFSKNLSAQNITTYQYRHVSPNNTEEFVKRETTYWSKVARAAIDKGTLTFWALLERVDGSDMLNSPNYLFVNTYTSVDTGDVWNATAVFPQISMDKMETNSISTVTSQYFLQDENWEQATKAVPATDFNYIIMVISVALLVEHFQLIIILLFEIL